MTSAASETVAFSSRPPQFQRSPSANASTDGDSSFALMLEASTPPAPADPAPRKTEPAPAAQKADAPAEPKTKTTEKPTNKAASDNSEPASADTEAKTDDKVVVEADADADADADVEENPVVGDVLPEVPEAEETAQDGSELDAEIAVVQVQAETVQPQTVSAPQVAAVTPLPPEAVVPAQAEGDAAPELAIKPVTAGLPAETPAPEAPVETPVAETPDLPLAAQAKSAPEASRSESKPELNAADLQTVAGEPADAEAESLLPQQSKTEHARSQAVHKEAEIQQPEQTKETKPAAQPGQDTKPAVPQMTALNTDTTNTPVPQTQPTLATDLAALTASQQRTTPMMAQTPVPVSGIAVEIAAQAKAGNNRFEIRLDPPELGRIDVRLDVDTEGNVKSRLVIDRADTYDLLRKDASTLERALQQAGLKTSDSGLEFTLRDQGSAQREARDQNQRHTERGIIPDADVLPAEAASGYGRVLGLGSGVDIRI